MPNVKVGYRLKNAEGKYWSYSNVFNKKGKEFSSISTMVYDWMFARGNPTDLSTFTIEKTTYTATTVDEESLADNVTKYKKIKKVSRDHSSWLSKFYEENGLTFGGYTHYLNCMNIPKLEPSEVMAMLKNVGFGQRSYKKSGDNFLLKDDSSIVTLQLCLPSGYSSELINLVEYQQLLDTIL